MALSKTERTELGSAPPMNSTTTESQINYADQRNSKRERATSDVTADPESETQDEIINRTLKRVPPHSSYQSKQQASSTRPRSKEKLGEGQGAGSNSRTFLCLALSSLETDAFSFMAAPPESSYPIRTGSSPD